ncbi:metallophosphoesterase family protein [Botrimarina sp.]|uniref:metallophosphoesterase family protein n=1 Tax=Botrimarina sp. TaxID=2795802 RepID=UPI0032ED06DA
MPIAAGWFAARAAALCCVGAACFGQDDRGEPSVVAPFTRLDTICVNDWWNRPRSEIIDVRPPRDEVVAFGLYTVSEGTLKLSAQLFPLYPNETRTVRLEVDHGRGWEEIGTAEVNDLGWSALFRIDGWDDSQSVPYRIRHGESAMFEGVVRKNPKASDTFSVAVLSCNSRKDRGRRPEYVRNLRAHNPDLLFFAGDQSYDHREHTAAWLSFGLQFRDVLRDRPCVTIPDDHDIGQPNLWGEGGKLSRRGDGADGGYMFHPEYVRMVERCQTAHLPDPVDPEPISRGLGVYFTRLLWGGVDFAIVEDRKFKSGPAGKLPEYGPRPDHVATPDYDPRALDAPGLTLLGERQLEFLRGWAQDHRSGGPKVLLSQTVFCGGPHLHGSNDNRLYADMDSNGWPQTGRDKAVGLLVDAGAVHLAGDQHIAMLLEYGLPDRGGAAWAMASPAIVNTIYGRWWAPLEESRRGQPIEGAELAETGSFVDGFGNPITMHAYANPESQDRGAGYGLVRFNKADGAATFECWPRTADVTSPDAEQFAGWPKTVPLDETASKTRPGSTPH